MKQCCECRDGEHDNIDEDVRLVVIIDPDTKKLYRRGYMCWHHRECYDMDGFRVEVQQ